MMDKLNRRQNIKAILKLKVESPLDYSLSLFADGSGI